MTQTLCLVPTGARGGEQRGVRGVWSGPVPLGAGANHFRGAVFPRSETEPEPGRPGQVPLCREEPPGVTLGNVLLLA